MRVLLLQVDVPDSAQCIQELTKVALLSSCTLLLAWSSIEAARLVKGIINHAIILGYRVIEDEEMYLIIICLSHCFDARQMRTEEK